jgi:hypothetical protein
MGRRSDWLERLWGVLTAAQSERFKLGRHDCVRVVARAVDAMTGSDWQSYLQSFPARREARLMLVPGAVECEVTKVLGEPLPVNQARRGDVVALDMPTGVALGICVGDRVAVASDGILYLPLSQAHCAWRVE